MAEKEGVIDENLDNLTVLLVEVKEKEWPYA